MFCKRINSYTKNRFVHVTNYDTEGKHIDKNYLKVGCGENDKPYSGEITDIMNEKYVDAYLNKIEQQHRGFAHNHNTYYGYEYEYDISQKNTQYISDINCVEINRLEKIANIIEKDINKLQQDTYALEQNINTLSTDINTYGKDIDVTTKKLLNVEKRIIKLEKDSNIKSELNADQFIEGLRGLRQMHIAHHEWSQ